VGDSDTILYRIVQHDPPTRTDMLSYQALGIAPETGDPEVLRLSAGISLFNTPQQARNQMRRMPPERRGFIAELRIPPDAPVAIERTGTQRGHRTLWGSPDDILGYVAWVILTDDAGTGDNR
jgi:hypothetical protein